VYETNVGHKGQTVNFHFILNAKNMFKIGTVNDCGVHWMVT